MFSFPLKKEDVVSEVQSVVQEIQTSLYVNLYGNKLLIHF